MLCEDENDVRRAAILEIGEEKYGLQLEIRRKVEEGKRFMQYITTHTWDEWNKEKKRETNQYTKIIMNLMHFRQWVYSESLLYSDWSEIVKEVGGEAICLENETLFDENSKLMKSKEFDEAMQIFLYLHAGKDKTEEKFKKIYKVCQGIVQKEWITGGMSN